MSCTPTNRARTSTKQEANSCTQRFLSAVGSNDSLEHDVPAQLLMSSCAKYRAPSTPRTNPTRLAPIIRRTLNTPQPRTHDGTTTCPQTVTKISANQNASPRKVPQGDAHGHVPATAGRLPRDDLRQDKQRRGPAPRQEPRAQVMPKRNKREDEDAGGCEAPRAAERDVEVPYDPEVV
jgi:hypothetical protein